VPSLLLIGLGQKALPELRKTKMLSPIEDGILSTRHYS